jgi:cell division protein FtsI/penicillin-binding protein 2
LIFAVKLERQKTCQNQRKRTKLEDHSIFVAFAPKDNPKIAIAILVENGDEQQ